MPPRKKDEPPTSTILSRWIGGQLDQLRVAAGLDYGQVAEMMDIGFRTCTRMHYGEKVPTVGELRTLLDIYGVTDAQYRADLEVFRRDAKRPGWATNYLMSLKTSLRYTYLAFCDIEERADRIIECGGATLPGLVQTPEFAQVVQALPSLYMEDQDTLVNVRLERQQRVFGRADGGPILDFIVDEAALRRHFGHPKVLAKQIEHVLTLVDAGRISFRVVPLETDMTLIADPFIILETSIRSVAVSCGHDMMPMFELPEDVLAFEMRYKSNASGALPQGESSNLCSSIVRTLLRE